MLKNFAKSFLLYGLAAGISRSMMILMVPIYTSVFTPNEYGIVDLLSGFSSLVIIICMLQLESGIARYYYESKPEDLRKLVSSGLWTILFFTITFSVVLYFSSGFVATSIFEQPDIQYLIELIAILVPVSVAFNFLVFLIRYEGKPLIYFAFIITQVLVSIVAITWMIYFNDFGVQGVLYGQVIGMAVPLPFLVYYFRRYVSFQWEFETMKKLMNYSLPLLPSVAINWGNAYLSRFLMLSYLSIYDIGLFSLAVRFATLFGLLEMAFTLTWSPFFWDSFSKQTSFNLYHSVFRLMTIFVFTLVCGTTLFSQELVYIFANPEYKNSAYILGILFLSGSLPVFFQMVGMGPPIVKKTYYSAIISLFGLLTNIGLLYILIADYGIVAMALSALIGNLSTLIVLWIVSERLYPIGYPVAFFIVVFVVAAAVVLFNFLFTSELVSRVLIAAVVLGGGLLYLWLSRRKFIHTFAANFNSKDRNI